MFYGPAAPLMDLLTSLDEKDASGRARAQGEADSGADETAQRESGNGPLPVDVKLVIEGDIPTNHIIERVIREALGSNGTVEKCLLSDFTPDVLLNGGTVILSRIGDPTAVPMLDWMTAHRIAYLYYIDDNFWELVGDTRLAQYYQYPTVRHTLARVVKEAKAVIVNSALLGEYIKKRFPRANIIHLNAPFDFSLIERVAPHEKAPGDVRIGFAGNVSRAADFVEILPAFERLLSEYPHVSLMFFGYCPPELIGRERVTYVPTVADYVEFIALKASSGLDIGIAPMTGSVSNLYKTNNKYREYGALKIAGIYTNTSPYKESVVDGKTGLLVEHHVDAWYAALKRLVVDAKLRGEIADAAYRDVHENYAQNVVARHWADMLFDFAARYSTGDPVKKAPRVIVASMRVRRVVNRTLLRAWMVSKRVQAAIARRSWVRSK
ncbi:glycosyltransferase [Burkholderia sp. R-69980]|nr:glycosyltransferase [Burkholderia sp. R-69980]